MLNNKTANTKCEAVQCSAFALEKKSILLVITCCSLSLVITYMSFVIDFYLWRLVKCTITKPTEFTSLIY